MADVFPSITMLIPELKLGEASAWNNLCDRFRDGLMAKTKRFLRSTRLERRWSADDLVQETFMKAWKQHDSFRGKTTSQFAKWLLRILQNTFVDLTRRLNLELSVSKAQEVCTSDQTPSGEFLSLEHEAILHSCLAELDAKSREILLLRHFDGLKFHQIAKRTNQNVNTVASLCRRALLRLSELMSKYEECDRLEFHATHKKDPTF